jgi:single-stranded-DNA-specific exonuclease
MRPKKWILKQKEDPQALHQLQTRLGIHPILCQLLVNRGIDTFDKAKKFFRPSLDDLHDPFLMKDMDRAVESILSCMQQGGKIMIYGDYDVDGTTSVALMYSFLSDFTDQLMYYIPDRYKEGYGVSYAGIDVAKESGCTLIISLDCGIKALEKVQYAKEKGIDFIICDHHRPGPKLPEAIAVLDPKRSDCEYPYKELSGCGVGFKLAQAIAIRKGLDGDSLLPLLDLVAVSIGADIVHITGENRVLAYFGLKVINSNPRLGFKAFIDQLKPGTALDIGDVVFKIAPRINAAGRISHATKAVELLVSSDAGDAEKFACAIDDFNTTRKDLDERITIEAKEQVIELGDEDAMTTVVSSEKWHKGVVGIVASRLIETYYRPTIVFTKKEGKYTGSVRSIQGFDVYEALDACSDHIEAFGGHKYAAGLTIDETAYTAFRNAFEDYVASRLEKEDLIEKVEVESVLELNDIDEAFFNILQQFEPHGPENLNPVFCAKQVIDTGWSRLVGENKDHLSLSLVHPQYPGDYYKGIGFRMKEQFPEIQMKRSFSICYSLRENIWKEKRSIQLFVNDIKF